MQTHSQHVKFENASQKHLQAAIAGSGSGLPALDLFYDDECELCCRLRGLVQQWDRSGQINTVALSTPDLDSRFPELNVTRARQHLTVRTVDGILCEDLAALRQVALRLPAIRRLGWIYRLPGVGTMARRAYRAVNRNRRRLCLKCGERWTSSRRRRRR